MAPLAAVSVMGVVGRPGSAIVPGVCVLSVHPAAQTGPPCALAVPRRPRAGALPGARGGRGGHGVVDHVQVTMPARYHLPWVARPHYSRLHKCACLRGSGSGVESQQPRQAKTAKASEGSNRGRVSGQSVVVLRALQLCQLRRFALIRQVLTSTFHYFYCLLVYHWALSA